MSAAREARPPDDHPITWPKVWLGHLLILIGEIEERAAAMPLEDAQTTSRSVASMASVLRKRGVRVPFRRAGGDA